MDRDEILRRFTELNVWQRGGQRAPHKPLLALYALGRWQAGQHDGVRYHDVDRDLKPLLQEFGPWRKQHHPEYPFWRLQSDGLWEVEGSDDLARRKGGTAPTKGALMKANSMGRFATKVQHALAVDPTLCVELATRILESYFPETLHPDILAAVGLELEHPSRTRRPRDPSFRPRVLTAYEYRCAVCALDLRIGTGSIALDAAHIKWHQAGGPDVEPNGVALCVLHHKVFDLGAFTIDPELRVLVSDQVTGSTGKEDVLLRFHGVQVTHPQRPEQRPAEKFLAWHGREVFKGAARHLPSAGERAGHSAPG